MLALSARIVKRIAEVGYSMHILRLSKTTCVAALALYALLVALGNLTDYWTNFAFVSHVLNMDQLPHESKIHWRAVTSPTFHHAVYILIICTEIAIGVFAAIGAVNMLRHIKDDAAAFQNAKSMALAGLTIGFLLYEGGFVAVAGEWFGMWQAQAWNGVQSAFRIAITMLAVLFFVSLKDE
jgi:predicted small integral membrane protein